MKKMKIMLLMALMIWGAAEAKAYDHNRMKGAPRVELAAKNKQKKECKRGHEPKGDCPDCKKGHRPAHPGMKPGTPPPQRDFHRGECPKRGCDKQIPHGNKGCCKRGPHNGKHCCDKGHHGGKEQTPPRK